MIVDWIALSCDDEVHILPRRIVDGEKSYDDHETSVHCWCRPELEMHKRELIIHRGFED